MTETDKDAEESENIFNKLVQEEGKECLIYPLKQHQLRDRIYSYIQSNSNDRHVVKTVIKDMVKVSMDVIDVFTNKLK